MDKIIFVLFAACFVCSHSLADRTTEVAGVYVNVQSRSGKISLGRRPNPLQDENAVTIELDELRELDSNGNEVGLSSSAKHSFSSFRMEDFEVSNQREIRYNNNLNAARIDIDATINYARLKLILIVFKQDGTIVENGEQIHVRNGTVKFNVEMSNWGFCNPCLSGSSREYGYYLELAATIKGKGDIRTTSEGSSSRRPKTYDLGHGNRLIASRQVVVDSRTVTMAPGYPAVRQRMGKQMFVMRFPKFTYKLSYDPIIMLSSSVTTTSSLLGLLICGLTAFMF